MSRRPTLVQRCSECKMHTSLCICALTQRLSVRTRVVLLMHHTELRKSTNTGRLALRCLADSQLRVHGGAEPVGQVVELAESTRPLLLYPSPTSTPLTSLVHELGHVTLFVPDGNWRQASKMRKRIPGLADLPCVHVPNPTPDNYRLRRETNEHGMATIEALARALAILEGEHGEAICQAMLRPFHAMVDRTLWSRGLLSNEHVRFGLPEGARRNPPPPA